MAHDRRMQEYFATANREKMRRPYLRRDHGPAAKPLAQRQRREEDAASGAKLEMARYKNKLNRAGTVGRRQSSSTSPCHVERSRDISNYSPRISGARSFQRGLRVAINATFFARDHFLSCFYRAMAPRTSVHC